jgi:hypothetical protein
MPIIGQIAVSAILFHFCFPVSARFSGVALLDVVESAKKSKFV